MHVNKRLRLLRYRWSFLRAVMIGLQRMARTPTEDDRSSCAPPSGSRATPEPSSFPILTERPDLPPHLTTQLLCIIGRFSHATWWIFGLALSEPISRTLPTSPQLSSVT